MNQDFAQNIPQEPYVSPQQIVRVAFADGSRKFGHAAPPILFRINVLIIVCLKIAY
ncbi:hypothetical protein D3C79_1055560 [compost metagenome]